MCASCAHSIKGKIFCQDCLVTGAELAGVAASSKAEVHSPARAALFALVPGIGAVYNQQYSKAVLHFLMFAGLLTAADYGPRIFNLAAFSFYVFTVIDAYRSAQEISMSRLRLQERATMQETPQLPIWGGVLVLMGVLFFLQNLGFDSFRFLEKYWPLVFIFFGIYLLLDFYLRPHSSAVGKGWEAAPSAGQEESPKAAEGLEESSNE